ncbi:hypothetical protein SADUNF_Sadunf03G0132900 [Salix dunnii]|uniref:Uncharacterized protein n=1 Tax=Salix dunnii TaxID=1413687 RepID=A0A835TE43_9ROSI|nr:hypothetical protein SADUNF_Sadunf03G0132900 [Salix dunnii]
MERAESPIKSSMIKRWNSRDEAFCASKKLSLQRRNLNYVALGKGCEMLGTGRDSILCIFEAKIG